MTDVHPTSVASVKLGQTASTTAAPGARHRPVRVPAVNPALVFIAAVVLAALNLVTFFGPIDATFADAVVLATLVALPGVLAVAAIEGRLPADTGAVARAAGCGVVVLLAVGGFANTFLPVVGVDAPLRRLPLVMLYDLAVAGLAMVAAARVQGPWAAGAAWAGVGRRDRALLGVAGFLPVAAVGGARLLDNGYGNALAVGTVVACAVYAVVAVTVARHPVVLPGAIFGIGLALLLGYSMRTGHVVGWDINQELFTYRTTATPGRWEWGSFKDPYNACMSITILPSVVVQLTRIGPEVVFKLFYPLLFSVVPVTLYALARRFTNGRAAFLAAMFFVAQTWFGQQMPALARQEVALLFVALVLLVLFDGVDGRPRRGYVAVFGVAMILSHYSTTFLFLLTAVAATLLYVLVRPVARRRGVYMRAPVPVGVLLSMLVVFFVWGSVCTSSTGSLSTTVRSLGSNIPALLAPSALGSAAEQLTFQPPKTNTQADVAAYYAKVTATSAASGIDLYPASTYADYRPRAQDAPLVAGDAGNAGLMLLLLRALKVVANVGVPLIAALAFALRARRKADLRMALLVISTVPVFALMLLSPVLKTDYNLTRLYMQGLLVLCVPIAALVSGLVARPARLVALAVSVALLLIYLNGVTNQVFGGPALLTFNNKGLDYELYAIDDAESASARWLAANRDPSRAIYADEIATFRLQSQGGIKGAIFDVVPPAIEKGAYVYLSDANVTDGVTYHRSAPSVMRFNAPLGFLDDNKDLVYSNGHSTVYR